MQVRSADSQNRAYMSAHADSSGHMTQGPLICHAMREGPYQLRALPVKAPVDSGVVGFCSMEGGAIAAARYALSLRAFCRCRKLQPPLPAGAPIKVVGRTDSNAAAYALSQWLQQAGNGTWLGGVNKTLPLPPKAKAVSGSGSVVTEYIAKTPGAIGCVASVSLPCVAA